MVKDWAERDRKVSLTTAGRRPALAAIPITRFGKYRLIGKLGHGGMAEVFLAYVDGPAGFRKLVVIKRLHEHLLDEPGFLDMFLDEARLAARLNHPNVVQTYEVDEIDGQLYLAMEYLDGQPLDRIRKRCTAHGVICPPRVAARVAIGALEGLSYAHGLTDYDGTPLEVVHRDISPHNVFVTYEGSVKLLDFGIAKASTHLSETQAGVVKGKLAYIAPEQGRGHPIDQRADLWSMGVVLWESLANRRLFQGGNDRATLSAALLDPIPDLREVALGVPEALARVCEKALYRDPDRRYQTAREMKDDLEAYLASEQPRSTRGEVSTFVKGLFSDLIKQHRKILERCLSDSPHPPSLGATSGAGQTPSRVRADSGARASPTPSEVSYTARKAEPWPDAAPFNRETTPSASGSFPTSTPSVTPSGSPRPEPHFQSSLWAPETHDPPPTDREGPLDPLEPQGPLDPLEPAEPFVSQTPVSDPSIPSLPSLTPSGPLAVDPDVEEEDLTPTSYRSASNRVQDIDALLEEIPEPPPPLEATGSNDLRSKVAPQKGSERFRLTPWRAGLFAGLLLLAAISTCLLIDAFSPPPADTIATSPPSGDDELPEPEVPARAPLPDQPVPVASELPAAVATPPTTEGTAPEEPSGDETETTEPRPETPSGHEPEVPSGDETETTEPRPATRPARSPAGERASPAVKTASARPRRPAKRARAAPEEPSPSDGDEPAARPPAKTAAPPAVEPSSPEEEEGFGYLRLDTIPWSKVSLGGRMLGTTPLLKQKLPAGTHVLSLNNPEAGITTTYRVTIRPGETTIRRLGLE